MLRELAEKAGVAVPRLTIERDKSPNAWAMSTFPFGTEIALHTGLIHTLKEAEVRAVLAHEVAHIRNGDTLAGTLLTSVNRLYLSPFSVGRHLLASSRQVGRRHWTGGASERTDTLAILLLTGCAVVYSWHKLSVGLLPFAKLAALSLLFVCSVALIVMGLELAWHWSREYLADRTGAHLTGDPATMAAGFKRIQSRRGMARRSDLADAHMYTLSPLRMAYATHPPVRWRHRRLLKLNRNKGSRAFVRVAGSVITMVLVVGAVSLGGRYALVNHEAMLSFSFLGRRPDPNPSTASRPEQPLALGEACTRGKACAAGLECRRFKSERKWCTRKCSPKSCGEGSVCVSLRGQPSCMLTCGEAGETCPSGLRCNRRLKLFGSRRRARVCVPR